MHPPEAANPADHSDAAKNERHCFEALHVSLRYNDFDVLVEIVTCNRVTGKLVTRWESEYLKAKAGCILWQPFL